MKLDSSFLRDLAKNKYFHSLPYLHSKRTREITTIVLTLITISLFGIIAINPTISTIVQLQKQLEDNKEVETKLKQKITNLGQLQKQYAQIQTDIPIVLQAIPISPDPSMLNGQVQTIAGTSNINLLRFQTQQADLSQSTTNSTNVGIALFSFSLTAEGSEDRIYDFIKRLANFNRIITLDALNIKAGPEGSGLMQLELRGKAYFKP